MDHNYYETRTPINPFKLELLEDGKFGIEAKDMAIGGLTGSLFFLHIKSLNVGDMRIAYELPNNDEQPRIGFIEGWYEGNTFKRLCKHLTDTSIFVKGTSSSSLDRFVNLINDNIDSIIADCLGDADDNTRIKGRMLYGHFTIENNKLQFMYKFERLHGEANRIAVLAFNKPFMDIIVKYFDVHIIEGDPETLYYIRPGFHETDALNDFVNVPNERIVTAYRDTTEFFFPTHTIKLETASGRKAEFVEDELFYTTNNIPYNLQKSHIELNKYILLADKQTSTFHLSWRLTVDQYRDSKSVITGEAEYIELTDIFDQFDMFKLNLGYVYSEDEYRELSYRKLMGITANTVYLQNGTSTELLNKIYAMLIQHYPDIGGNKDISLWQSIRDLIGDRETLEEIYKLLYHAYPQEPYGPQSKKIKIDF